MFNYIPAQNTEDEEAITKTTPVGPVAGGIMGCFLVLALGVYCYRHRIHRNSLQYISTLPENQNRHSNFYEGDDLDQAEDNGYGLFVCSVTGDHSFMHGCFQIKYNT